jgi:hypothetical protein
MTNSSGLRKNCKDHFQNFTCFCITTLRDFVTDKHSIEEEAGILKEILWGTRGEQGDQECLEKERKRTSGKDRNIFAQKVDEMVKVTSTTSIDI